MVNSFNSYYYAAAATAIAGILHIVLSADGIGRTSLSGIFFLIRWYSTAILGIAYGQKMGKNMVLHWNWWYYSTYNNLFRY